MTCLHEEKFYYAGGRAWDCQKCGACVEVRALHDAGDPECVLHIPGYIYTRLLHLCKPCHIIHDAAGPCQPGYHRGMPDGRSCRCGKFKGVL